MRLLGFTEQTLNDNIKIYTTGCEASMSDAYNFARTLPPDEKAIVFGTCTFIEDRSLESTILTDILQKVHPNHKMYAIGCDINLNRDRYQHCEHTVTNEEVAKKISVESTVPCTARTKGTYIEGLPVKVQDGCANRCAYCVINKLRNKPFSVPYKDLVRQIREQISISPDYKSIILCGTEVANYYDVATGYKISDVLKHLVEDIPELRRITLTAIDPAHPETEEIIRIVGADKKHYLPYVLLGVQAGCDKTLKRMGRRHNVARVRELHKIAKELGVACGWDVIVGFPGETEEDFMETYNLLCELKPVSQNLFMYSDREGTLASEMDGKVSFDEIERRNKMLHDAMYDYFYNDYDLTEAVREYYDEDAIPGDNMDDADLKRHLAACLIDGDAERYVDLFDHNAVAELVKEDPSLTIVHVNYDMDRDAESEIVLYFLTNKLRHLPFVVHAPKSIKEKYDTKKFEEYFHCVLFIDGGV